MPVESPGVPATDCACAGPETDIDLLLAHARAGLDRLRPAQAWAAAGRGALIADTRPEFQRRAAGEVPGAIVIERNHLEWRLDPKCEARIPEATSHDVHWILICAEGYSSSLAAAVLRQLGLRNATDVIGGFDAWAAEGLPIVRPAHPTPPRGPGEAGLPQPPVTSTKIGLA
ncbi:rhodanese-like domain-containing protein [Nonomuraea sediminis]|uniref:rhodanese-like domain-containing protein n=1 Tax=Nonomuraea sediminis TaxID=2835864 RepID=UPI001BDC3197|nr:rhodanese-like domain-containing protein [Nonomuraea sediminis]